MSGATEDQVPIVSWRSGEGKSPADKNRSSHKPGNRVFSTLWRVNVGVFSWAFRIVFFGLLSCESLWSNPCHHCDSLGFEPKKIHVLYDLDLQRAYQDRQNGKHWKIPISWRFGRAFGRKFLAHETRSKCVQTPKSTIMRQCRWSCSISILIRLKIHLESIFAVGSVRQLKLPPSGFCRTKLAWGSTQPQAYVFESSTCRVSRRFKVSDFQHHLLPRDLGYGVTIPPDRALWSFVSCRWKLWSAWHGRICYVPLQMAP